jgi:X-Pro dipeptidyl-peptidase
MPAYAMYVETGFDYQRLYQPGQKRTAAGECSCMDAALAARPKKDWNYSVPCSGMIGYYNITDYDYYLVRGYAVVLACGIGTYGSEGFELCGTDLERDSHKCVVEWLSGERAAYTDKTHNIAVKADWCSGSVAMTGCSYGGTLPYEVATTGVKGLKTIIPYAGIASWYDYTNSQGVPTRFDVNYADSLAVFNCGGTFLDNDWTVPNEDYGAWLWQIAQDQDATNGDYAPIWAASDYSDDYQNIACSALIVHGLNDFNVTTRQADLMMRAFQKAGRTAKLVLHQDGHQVLDSKLLNGELWQELVNKWLSHYLYDVENGIENMPPLLVQSNLDGEFRSFDAWGSFPRREMTVYADSYTTAVTTEGLAAYATQYLEGESPELIGLKGQELYYATLDQPYAGAYILDIPEGTTILGVPEVHVKLSTPVTDKDGLMITAVLVDYRKDGTPFKAYMTKDRLGETLPVRTIGSFEPGGGLEEGDILQFVQSSTHSKCLSFGWTDLCNPGLGFDSSEYAKSTDLQAGRAYDYTFYMMPTAYTVAPGHALQLIITAWDPYRAFLDEDYTLDPTLPTQYSNFNYSFIIDNASLTFTVPVAQG